MFKIANNIGDSIRFFRKKAGLTQPELAKLSGVSFSTLRRWEVYGASPRIEEIKQLCEVLHCTKEELLNGPEIKKDWELRLLTPKEAISMSLSTIDLTGKATSASLEMSDSGMGLTISAGYDVWEDDAKFEDLISQLRKKRAAGLKLRKEDW